MRGLQLLDLKNVALRVGGEPLLNKRRVPRVRRVEDVIDLLERAVLGLRDEEPDDESLDRAPAGKDDVQLPANLL